ncbi:MAG: hypothetical protein ACLTSX_14530 [Collinsella sp.]
MADKKTETAFQPSLSWRACVALIAAVTTLALDYVTKVFSEEHPYGDAGRTSL